MHRIATIARWKPVHNGHLPVLRALCEAADHAVIGMGSSNAYDLRNPFTLQETETMLRLALSGWDNYSLLPVPDLHDGPRWRAMVKEMMGDLDLFVTDNPYVYHLLRDDYRVERPVSLIPAQEQIRLNGTMVRLAMARGEDWQSLTPPAVADYILQQGLDLRFRREFGLQTLAQAASSAAHIIFTGE